MAANRDETVTVTQKVELNEKTEHEVTATELAEGHGVGTE
jgi:hypothetical protein